MQQQACKRNSILVIFFPPYDFDDKFRVYKYGIISVNAKNNPNIPSLLHASRCIVTSPSLTDDKLEKIISRERIHFALVGQYYYITLRTN
jgi:hypothetical protein